MIITLKTDFKKFSSSSLVSYKVRYLIQDTLSSKGIYIMTLKYIRETNQNTTRSVKNTFQAKSNQTHLFLDENGSHLSFWIKSLGSLKEHLKLKVDIK